MFTISSTSAVLTRNLHAKRKRRPLASGEEKRRTPSKLCRRHLPSNRKPPSFSRSPPQRLGSPYIDQLILQRLGVIPWARCSSRRGTDDDNCGEFGAGPRRAKEELVEAPRRGQCHALSTPGSGPLLLTTWQAGAAPVAPPAAMTAAPATSRC